MRWILSVAMALLLSACGGGSKKANKEAPPSDATEAAAPASKTDKTDAGGAELCAAHGEPSNLCFICDASLREPGRLWCEEHAHYEDRCWECHPELRDNARLYCDEHGLYEDECFLCHPELRSSAPATSDSTSQVLLCDEHGVEERMCGICHPELAASLSPGQGLRIRFASAESATKAGIKSAPLGSLSSGDAISAVGELGYNMDRLARITSPVDGVIRSVQTDVGASVSAGKALVSIASPHVAELRGELSRAQAEELVASQNLEREEKLFEEKAVSAQEVADARARQQSARASTRAVRQSLRDLGLTQDDVEAFAHSDSEGSGLALRAPFSGTVVERNATLGDVVKSGDVLFQVADLDVMWLTLAVTEADAAHMRVGSRVDVRVESLQRDFAGRVTWVSSNLDEATRTARVRAEIPNRERVLRAGMFVNARISTSGDRSALSIDRDSLYLIDGRNFVFVRLENDLYELRCVEARPATPDRVVVMAGLSATDQVVIQRSYLVKSEFQKSRLGAGCVD
jgi:cobalt-zinc-cadmium efflux system membrane fusion protein